MKVPYEKYLGCEGVAQPVDLDHFEKRGGFVCQQKMDGWWGCLEIPKKGTPTLTSRWGNKIDDHAITHCDFIGIPGGTALVGEYMKDSHLFYVFDLIEYAGAPVKYDPLFKRLYLLNHAIFEDKISRENLRSIPSCDLAFHSFYSMIKSAGGEGVVLKLKEGIYLSTAADKKTHEWIKCK